MRRFWQVQSGLANLANQRLIARAHQMFPLAKVAFAFTTGEMRTGSLIDEMDVSERILRRLGLWQEGVCVHSCTDPPGETTLGPWLDDSLPDYDIEPDVAFQDYRCPSRLIC